MNNIDIRKYIKNNFKDASARDIEDSINSSIKSGDEVVLPGLGVFFEVLWNNCSEDKKEYILSTIMNNV